MALFHDRFADFSAALQVRRQRALGAGRATPAAPRRALIPALDRRAAPQEELRGEEAFAALAADLRERMESGVELPTAEELRAAVQRSTRALAEGRLLEYLQANQNQLGMYLVPSAPVMRQMDDADLVHGMRMVPQQ